MGLSGLSVSRCKPWIDFSSRERLWVCNWPFYCASKVKPDCFQAYFWSGKIESVINLIFRGPSVCYHVVMLCSMYPLWDPFISVFSIVTKISQMCAEATHYEWPNLDLSHQTKVVNNFTSSIDCQKGNDSYQLCLRALLQGVPGMWLWDTGCEELGVHWPWHRCELSRWGSTRGRWRKALAECCLCECWVSPCSFPKVRDHACLPPQMIND